jgi:hypothetical protein
MTVARFVSVVTETSNCFFGCVAETQNFGFFCGNGQVEINEEDEKALAAFMSKDNSAQRTLGDIILQKIREKDAEVSVGSVPFNCHFSGYLEWQSI